MLTLRLEVFINSQTNPVGNFNLHLIENFATEFYDCADAFPVVNFDLNLVKNFETEYFYGFANAEISI